MSLTAGTAVAGLLDGIVVQKDRHFGSGDISLRAGQALILVNGDERFVHHPYAETGPLVFDAGDMEPGTRAVVAFPHAGDYTVLCGVHPKMKLTVRVR